VASEGCRVESVEGPGRVGAMERKSEFGARCKKQVSLFRLHGRARPRGRVLTRPDKPYPGRRGMLPMGMIRELPFGARITDSFVKKLKWETAKAYEDLPDAMPCLCAEEESRHVSGRAPPKRIDFEKGPEIPTTNRLILATPSPVVLIKERGWVLCFDMRPTPPEDVFGIDGVRLHIPRQAQWELKGATVSVVNDRIVVTHGC
jgi:hypothetical protein